MSQVSEPFAELLSPIDLTHVIYRTHFYYDCLQLYLLCLCHFVFLVWLSVETIVDIA